MPRPIWRGCMRFWRLATHKPKLHLVFWIQTRIRCPCSLVRSRHWAEQRPNQVRFLLLESLLIGISIKILNHFYLRNVMKFTKVSLSSYSLPSFYFKYSKICNIFLNKIIFNLKEKIGLLVRLHFIQSESKTSIYIYKNYIKKFFD